MDMVDYANKIYQEEKLEEAFSIVDYIISHSEDLYPKTNELRHMLDNLPCSYEGEKDAKRASTTWRVGGTLHEFLEEPFTGRTAFVAWDVSPNWAITLSME